MPKKQGKNAFWYFMSDWRAREESRGREFRNGFRDVQSDPACSEAWKSLAPEEKARYKEKANKRKTTLPVSTKLTGTGESVDAIKLSEKEQQEFDMNIEAHIRYIISEAKKHNAVPRLKFLFLHMNWYYEREPDEGQIDFCPAEFAIAQFSLEGGVSRYYHEIIRTTLDSGYLLKAMETSQSSHKLRWDLSIGEGNWNVISEKMRKFLEPHMVGGTFPPIYTSKKIAHAIPSLQRRMYNADGTTLNIFEGYTIETLLTTMFETIEGPNEMNRARAFLANITFTKEPFAFTPNIECDYHKSIDGAGQFCSLSVVRQWAFSFCDFWNQPLGLKLIPGIHCPEKIDGRQNSIESNKNRRKVYNHEGSTPSVLSATGVSEHHRLMVSERNREDERRRKKHAGKIEIIDHSKINALSKDECPPEPVPIEPIAVAVSIPVRSCNAPPFASQALSGLCREVPSFDKETFPILGGRNALKNKSEKSRRPEVPIWTHRNCKKSHEESD